MKQHKISLQPDTVVQGHLVPATVGPAAGYALLLQDQPLIATNVGMTPRCSVYDLIKLMSGVAKQVWLDRHSPDVAVGDVENGRSTGAVLGLLKANIPFVVHSDQKARSFAGSSSESGAWVSKPSTADDLAGTVRTAALGLFQPICQSVPPA